MSARHMDFERLRHAPVGVVGAGSMGAGIAQVAAQAGHEVLLHDLTLASAQKALERIRSDLQRQVERGRLAAVDAAAIATRLRAAATLEELAGAGLVVEAVAERVDVKRELFQRLEALVDETCLLATNTSSISITAIAQGLRQPGRVAGLHFFNPATRMKLVEVIRGVATRDDTAMLLHALAKAWGKVSVDAPNAPGFIVNRVARPFYAEALRLLAEHVGAPQDIDAVLREAAGFAMGPFELIDLIGADVNLSVTESVFAATAHDRRYAPHLIQQELVRSGRFGRKTGAGFYGYGEGQGVPAVTPVQPALTMPGLAVAEDPGLLATLQQRLAARGIAVEVDAGLPPECLRIGAVRVALTDGRTAAQRAHETGTPVLLLDLCGDFAATPLLGATSSPGAEASLPALAALLAPAGIRLLALADVAGLVAMRTVACLANEAADVLAWSGARAADIDTAMQLGTAYPRGPLTWADALGASRLRTVLAHLQAHYGEERYRCSPALHRNHFTGARFHD